MLGKLRSEPRLNIVFAPDILTDRDTSSDCFRTIEVAMYRSNVSFLVVALLAIGLTGCSLMSASAPVSLPEYWPTDGWRTDRPEGHGFDSGLANVIAEQIPQLPFLDGLIIIRHGYIVHESYYNGYDADSLHDIASVTKSWTSALVGMAHVAGFLPDLDAPLPTLLPDYFVAGAHDDKRTITLRHLLQMRSGLAFEEDVLNTGGYGGSELLDRDLTALSLSFPVWHPPGESWNYSTLDTQLIAAIMQRAVGEPLAAYAQKNLFAALGIDAFNWWKDGAGTTIGGQNLSMRPRDMAKLGLLYLHNGVWEGEQLVPRSWVTMSISPQNETLYYPPTGQAELIEWYGYHWWVWKGEWFSGQRSFQAMGYGGQQVLVFPELDLILVTTSQLPGLDTARDIEQRTALGALFLDVILPAITDVKRQQ